MSADYQPGDHLVVSRHLYTHHGVYAGDGWAVHKDFGPVRIESLQTFSAGAKIRVCPPQPEDFPAATILARAVSRLGENRYDLLTDNCEHFVYWCRNGKADSPQITASLRALSVGLAVRALLLHPAVAATAGFAAYVLLDERHRRKMRHGLTSLGEAVARKLPRFAWT